MAKDEQVALLKKGVDAWNAWRDENANIRPDLRKVNLSRANLRKSDLSEANFSWADLGEADLREANLIGANLRKADLRKANLFKANLGGTHLREADLREANVVGANLRKTDLHGADLREAKFIGASWAHLRESDLQKVNHWRNLVGRDKFLRAGKFFEETHGAELSGTTLREADLSGANLDGTDLRKADFLGANLSGAKLHNTDLSGANLSGADLSGAELIEADLSRANLSAANLSAANLSGATLQSATLVDTDFTGADLTGCRVYGVSAWQLRLERTRQQNLVITKWGEPTITVDNIEVAQFIYLMLHNEKVRDVIDTITSKVVLILGRFTDERKAVLDALRDELRKRNYLPILFDFNVSASRDITETVSLLARMARFVVAEKTFEDFSRRTPFARFGSDMLSPKIDVAESKDAIEGTSSYCETAPDVPNIGAW
jgi:uncharacterized protein YjbI with pentapeptide repeats